MSSFLVFITSLSYSFYVLIPCGVFTKDRQDAISVLYFDSFSKPQRITYDLVNELNNFLSLNFFWEVILYNP